MDCSLPGSSVYGISQVRTLEWVAISLQNLNYNQGLNPHPLQWKLEVLTAGLPGNSQYF